MHTEQKAVEEGETMTEAESATAVEEYASPQSVHNIMNVLKPATPPVVKNARIIRRFDLEAAKTDPRPASASKPEKAEQEARRREERAQRNQSLFDAAGLV